MKISLRVDVEGMYWNGGTCAEVPELYCRCFEPMKTTDNPVMAWVTGDTMEKATKTVMRTRNDAAEILARELAALIVHEMSKHDTHNGYSEKGNAEWEGPDNDT